MSRQQFLAELTQYLTFVTPAEREQIIAVFEEKFDSVGLEGETALLMELGTPMSIAIALKRRKEAGELTMHDAASEESVVKPSEPSDASPPPVDDAPAAFAPPEASPEPAAPVKEPAPPPPKTDDEIISEPDMIDEEKLLEEIPAMNSAGAPVQIEHEEPATRKMLSAGAAIGAGLLSIVTAAILLIPAAAGGCLVIIMANFVFGALRTMSTITDALWMFAFGLVAGAIGLLILWFFLWAIISIIRRLFYGKPATKSAFRLSMKKVWKVIWTLFIIFLILGIACGAVSFSLGGDPSDLFDNSVSASLFDWLSNNFVTNLFANIFG